MKSKGEIKMMKQEFAAKHDLPSPSPPLTANAFETRAMKQLVDNLKQREDKDRNKNNSAKQTHAEIKNSTAFLEKNGLGLRPFPPLVQTPVDWFSATNEGFWLVVDKLRDLQPAGSLWMVDDSVSGSANFGFVIKDLLHANTPKRLES